MLSVPQTAARLGISRQRVHQLVQSGELTATQVGRAWVIDESEVQKRLDKKKGRPPGGGLVHSIGGSHEPHGE